jgi:uracil-DNA glycosylase family 4
MFTGDRSGEWLYRALHKAGFADRPDPLDPDLGLTDCLITAVVRCPPPRNRPTPQEITNCTHWLLDDLVPTRAKVVVALGVIAFTHVWRVAPGLGWEHRGRRPPFGHGVEVPLEGGPLLIASYHPSQQNTFTGRLTEPMLDRIFASARRIIGRATDP